MKLGRRAPKRAPALHLESFLTGVVPDHPPYADHFSKVPKWILGQNDRYGVCGPVSVANNVLLTTTYLADSPVMPTQTEIFDLYRRSGNPNFDPVTGRGDNGVDMQTMCEALLRGGIGGRKPVAFASVNPKDTNALKAAIAIIGSGLEGVTLMKTQVQQTDAGVWDYAPSGIWGGHAVLSGFYGHVGTSPADLRVITWGQIVGQTARFLARQLDEFWVLIWPEHLKSRAFMEGVDVPALAAAFQALTGQVLPVPVTPPVVPPVVPPSPPVTPPVPQPGTLKERLDQVFAEIEGNLAGSPHTLAIVKLIHAWMDRLLSSSPSLMKTATTAGDPTPFRQFVDALFAELLAHASPWEVPLITIVQQIVDSFI